MKKPNGGQAFPYMDEPGMTLRDWFAGQALMLLGAGLLSSVRGVRDVPLELVPAVLANEAYRVADAMLAEREK